MIVSRYILVLSNTVASITLHHSPLKFSSGLLPSSFFAWTHQWIVVYILIAYQEIIYSYEDMCCKLWIPFIYLVT